MELSETAAASAFQSTEQTSSKTVAANTPEPRYTLVEYLALEERSLVNHEYDNGKIIPMSGGTPVHSKIKASLVMNLGVAVRNSTVNTQDVFNSDIRIHLPAVGRAVMPDAAVVTGVAEFSIEKPVGLLLNPTLIVEVLSESTENYDRSEKFKLYRTLPSLEEYVLVSQDQARMETFVKKDGKWFLHEDVDGLDASVELTTLGASIALSDIYRNVPLGGEKSQKKKRVAKRNG